MENLIQKYLTENNVEGKNGIDYRLEDSGNGIEIKGWTLKISEPTFTQEQIDADILDVKKQNKIAEVKKVRNTLLENKKFTINVEGVSCQFWLRNSDLSALQSRFASLLDNEATRSWGAVDGSRVELNKPAYLSLIRHITDNDETVFGEYVRMKEEIESAPDLEALEEIDINFNL